MIIKFGVERMTEIFNLVLRNWHSERLGTKYTCPPGIKEKLTNWTALHTELYNYYSMKGLLKDIEDENCKRNQEESEMKCNLQA